MKLSMEDSYRFLPQDIRQNCEAVTPKLTRISRVSEKSLLCNVSMNTCLDDQTSGKTRSSNIETAANHIDVSKSVSDKIIGGTQLYIYMCSLSHLSKETGFLPSPLEMHFHF